MRGFFVPWRVLFPYANEYVEQLPYVDGSRTQRVWTWCPCTDYGALASVFTYENMGEIVETWHLEDPSPTRPYDFIWYNDTPEGFIIIHINSLILVVCFIRFFCLLV